MTSTFRSLRTRNFRLFFVGQFISQSGTWMRMVAMTLLVLDLTDDGVAVGLLTACQFLPVLVLVPFAGVVADRMDKRRLLVMVQCGLAVHSVVLIALASVDRPPLVAIYVMALVGGVGTAFESPARRSVVVELVAPDLVQNAVSLNSAVLTGSRIFGPALAGLLVTTVGYQWCFALDSVSYIAVIVSLVRMDPAQLRPPPVATRAKGQVREGLRYVRSVPALWVSLVMMTIVGTFAFNFQVVLPLLATRTLDGTGTSFTLLYSVLSVGSLVGALYTARRSTIDVRHVIVSAAAFGVAMSALAVAPALAFAFPVALVVGVASVSFITSSTTLLQLRADPGMRGRVLALQTLVFLGSTPVGGPVIGAVSEVLGARFGVAIGALACFVAAGWGYVVARRLPPAVVDDDADVVTAGTDMQPA